MELLSQYGLFLAKIATVVVAIAVVAVLIVNLTQRKRQRGELRITRLSEQYKEMQEEMSLALLDSHQQKLWLKAQKKNGSGRGRMRAGAGSHDEQRTLQFTPKICGGRFLGICAYIGCILQQHDESAGCG